MPGVGHLVQAPARIYLRTGDYHEATLANQRAVLADQASIVPSREADLYATRQVPEAYRYLCAGALLEGRREIAVDAADRLAARATTSIGCDGDALVAASRERDRVRPWLVRAWFGLWSEVRSVPEPPNDAEYTRTIWHYVRGLAALDHGDVEESRFHLAAMPAAAAVRSGAGESDGETLEATVAAEILAGKLALADGGMDRGIEMLVSAVDLLDRAAQDGTARDAAAQEAAAQDAAAEHAAIRDAAAMETPGSKGDAPAQPRDADGLLETLYPARQYLGAALLEAKRFSEAEAVFRHGLAIFPENGWALFGLERSLRGQGRVEEADGVAVRLERAWRFADVPLPDLDF
ncbi:MAG: hypothetical protein R3E12_07030 [Candidatus Eisenbacteria bacterium]